MTIRHIGRTRMLRWAGIGSRVTDDGTRENVTYWEGREIPTAEFARRFPDTRVYLQLESEDISGE